MAWNMSAAKRRALVKLQLRDKHGRWIEMGGGVKWYSSKLKKQISGTVVGTKGENALVRLDKDANSKNRAPLVSVPARHITVVDEKASLAPNSAPGTPVDQTAKFEKPIAVANESNGAPSSNGFVKPSDSPEDWNVSVTSDGNAYVGRKDGSELYFPARSLEAGDVLVAPEGGDETKPFSIGKGWAKKGVERVNANGPKTGTVLRIEGDRYAVVQLPDGFTVPDKKHEGEQTDLITVGLSNSVIKLTDGMKTALGDHLKDTFDGNADEQHVDDSEESNSDHVGREVPEDQVAQEADPANVDLTDLTDGEEEAKAAPITEKARELDVPQADNSGSDNQNLNENGLTDDEQKMVKAYDRMAQRAYDQGNAENGATYEANANRLRKLGEDRRAGAKADHQNPEDKPVKDVQEAERQQREANNEKKITDVSHEEMSRMPKGTVLRDPNGNLAYFVKQDGDNWAHHLSNGDPSGNVSSSASIKNSDTFANHTFAEPGTEPNRAPESSQSAPNQQDTPEPQPASDIPAEQAPETAPEASKANVSLDALEAQAKADGDTVLYHGGLPEGTTLDGIDLNRNGTQQNKRGQSFGGFYLTDETSKSWSDKYAMERNGVMHGFAIDKNARIDDRGKEQIDRISAEDRAKAAETADIIKGRDLLGRTQYVILNKDVVKGVGETNLKNDKSSENSAPAENAPEEIKPISEAEKKFDAIRAEIRDVTDNEDPRRQASDSADQNALDSEHEGIAKYSDEWYDIWNSTYGSALNDLKAEAGQKSNNEEAGHVPEDTQAPNLQEPDASAETQPEEAAPRLTSEMLDYLPEGTVLTTDIKGLTALPTHVIDGKRVVLHGNAVKRDGKWVGPARDLDAPKVGRWGEAPTIQLKDIPESAINQRYVTAVPLSLAVGGRPFDGNMDAIRPGDYVTLKNGKKGPYSPKADGSPAITTENHNGFRQLGIKATDIDRVKKVGTEPALKLEKTPEVPASPNLEEPNAPESTPKVESSQESSTEGFQPTDDAPYEFLGANMPTLFRQAVRGNSRSELEHADESARESEYDQGYRMYQGKIEVYDFDRALSSLEDNIIPWQGYLEAFPTRENPNASGYTGGHTKAKVTSVVNGIEKLREAIRAAKDERESNMDRRFLNGYDINSDKGIRGLKKTDGQYEHQDYIVDEVSPDLLKALPEGSVVVTLDPEKYDANLDYVKIADNQWARSKGLGDRGWDIYTDNDMWGEPVETGIRLPDHERAGYTEHDLNEARRSAESKRRDDQAFKENWDKHKAELDAKKSAESAPNPEATPEPAPTPEVSPEAPQGVIDTPEAGSSVDGEPDSAVVSHLNENAVIGDDNERRAAGLYLGGARYNSALRSGDLIDEFTQERIDQLTGFIDKQPEFGQETTLYRGMAGNFLPDAANRVGEVVTEPAFMSTSLKRSEAQIFAGSSDGSGVLMELKARPEDKALSINAAYMEDQSSIPEEYRQKVDVTAREAEMLMKPSTSFKINGVEEREIDGKKYQYVQAEVVDTPEASSKEEGSSKEQLNERGLTKAEEDQHEQHMIDADVEARAGDDHGVQEYRDKADAILQKGQDRLSGAPENTPSEQSTAPEVYTEGGPGRVPAYKATVQAIKDSGVGSVRISASDATKKDFTPEEIEHRLDTQEKTGLHDYIFDLMPKEFKRFKDQSAPADPINLPEAGEAAPEASKPTGSLLNLKPTPEEQAKLDEFDKAMDAAVASDDTDAFDKASDAKYDLMESIAGRPTEESATDSIKISPEDQADLADARQRMTDAVASGDQKAGDEAAAEYVQLMEDVDKKNRGTYVGDEAASSEEISDSGTHPLDAAGVKRRTPEAIVGEDYAPTQQQQDVIDAVLGGLDTKVQAMAGTGKTSTLVALSRRIGEQGGQAIYIAYNKTVQEEAERRMKGLPVQAKTGHGVAYQWALKNKPFLNVRVDGRDPMRPIAFNKDDSPKDFARKRALTSAGDVSYALGIKEGDVKEDGGIPLTKSAIVLAVKKTVESYALSDSDTIQTSHVPDTFEISEAHLPKIVEFANDYWADLSREDGDFRVTHDVYRKHWALSRPDLTDGSGGNNAGANILYIDEAQDTPPVLAKVVADQKMQKVIVGDANQAIYAFAQNIDYLSEADGDIELPLNKSWRFGPEVADAGNRFLEMLGSDSRVIGGGGSSKITYGMEDADAVLVRTNAGMIHAIVEETDRNRRVTAPKGTRSQLESMVETVEALMQGYAPETPHDDLIGFKNWDQVKGAYASGDKGLGKIVKLFDVVGNDLRNMKPEDVERAKEEKMARAKKAIDNLVIDVPLHNTVRMVQKGDRTYLEPVEENPNPVDEKTGKQKEWGGAAKQYAVENFSAALGKSRKPWLTQKGLTFKDQMFKYRDEGGIETVGWKKDRNRKFYTEDPEVAKKFATFGGVSDVTVSTAHKSKGLEWDRVRIGDDFIGPYEDSKTGAMVWPEDDEYKLGYVALTRAAKELDPGSLSYVYDYTKPNGGVPGQKKSEDSPAPVVSDDTDPDLGQVVEESPLDSAPDTEEDLDTSVAAEEFGPDVVPAPEPDVEVTPEPTPEPEVAPAPESATKAPLYDDITGLTAEEEAHKDDLLKQAKEAKQRGNWNEHGRLIKEINSIFDMGRERWKAQHASEKKQKSQPAQKPVESEVAPEPVTPVVSEPIEAPAAPAAPYDHEGLTPQERRRTNELERWINDVYRGKGQGNVKKMENELFDMLTRGEKRKNGEPDAESTPVDETPEFETPAHVADAPAIDETPSPVDEVPVVAPASPKPKSVPTGRKRGASTVPDANGDQIRVGDTITHKKHGSVTVTGVLPGAGRVTFIDPKTGKESSAKGDAISLNRGEAPAEAPLGIMTGTPGDRLIDPNSGKKAFIGADGLMIVTGQRVRDAKTGQVGTVQTVYTGADKKASVPILFDGEKEPRRVRGTQLSHADNGNGGDATETLPEAPQTPEVTPEAPKAPEQAPKAPEPTPEAPKAPEPVSAPIVDEKTARRKAAIGNAIDGSEVHSKDGGEIYTKITSDVWENHDATDSLTDDEVMDRILNGERDGKGYIIRTPNPVAPKPDPTPAPEPQPEATPEAPLSGQELANTLTYESTLHMSDGDLADMMARYADDPAVFDKIMEIMDERDAHQFLPVETDRTGATHEDQPPLFDIPEPVAKEAAKRERKLTPQQKASEEYQNYVMSQYSQALNDLNGVLLNEAGKAYARGAGGSDLEINLFSGSSSIARKYASEELLQWWAENGRETLGSFRFGMYGWENDRKAAQRVRNLGYQRGQIARDRSNV